MEINGKVVYQNLSGGFWGIVGSDGQKWLPTNMPAAFKKIGLEVKVEARKNLDYISIYMWGTPVDIIRVDLKG